MNQEEERVITLVGEDGRSVSFAVLEETRINGSNYLMVTNALEEEAEEGECYILKDLSECADEEALYEFVEDDNEIDYLYKIFSELLADADVSIEK